MQPEMFLPPFEIVGQRWGSTRISYSGLIIDIDFGALQLGQPAMGTGAACPIS